MSEVINVTVMGKQYPIIIDYDEYAESPRRWGNLGTMLCKHPRYDLGDVQVSDNWCVSNLNDFIAQYAYNEFINKEYSERYIDSCGDLNALGLQRAGKWIAKNWIYLPLFLYDHSGLSMSTTAFSCHWDSGCVGFIYCTKAQAKKCLGLRRLTEQHIERVKQIFKSEVDLYSNYLEGSVYFYRNDDFNLSRGGFFGYGHDKNGLLESATEEIFWAVKHNNEDHDLDVIDTALTHFGYDASDFSDDNTREVI